ncbi:MAG: ABC transporter substrate-binding protein [Oscillochloris sp.]|nr:ABC transporter substrate-binding protein [Oscillochloris sp.]
MTTTNDEIRRTLRVARDEVLAGRMSRRGFMRLAGALGLSAGAAALAACGGTPAAPASTAPAAPASTDAPAAADPTVAPEPAAAPGMLRVAFDPPVQLDPAYASADIEIAILNAIYDYLVDIDAANNVTPRLASDWTVSDDGLIYRFNLVQDATFHDGSPLTANDVVWTFNRLRDPALELPTADLYANISEISADGDTTVVFTLAETNPFFLYDLSDNHALVLKAETEDPATSFNGTGPFVLADYSPENRMSLTANENYFIAGKPASSGLEFIFFSDNTAAVDALRGGQVDLVMRMPTPLFLTLQNEPGLVTSNVATNGFDMARLRVDREPGSNPLVVEAFKYATDRNAIFQTVSLGLGAEGRDSPIGPLFTAYYTTDTPLPPRDPARARELLAEAGYPDGLQLDFHVPDSGDRPDLAVVLKEQWAEAGIDVNVIVEPESVYFGDNGWLEVDLGITNWGSRPIPQFYLDVMLISDAIWNETRISDPEIDQLAQTAGTTLDEEERVRAYAEIQRILIERGPIIIPYFFAQLGAIREGYNNFAMKAFAGRTDLAAISAPPAA